MLLTAPSLAKRATAEALGTALLPGDSVHPAVIEAMREEGIDLVNATPQRLASELVEGATLLVTMGCGDACPVVPGLERDDWPLEDPKGKPLAEVRRIRDDVCRRVNELIEARKWMRP